MIYDVSMPEIQGLQMCIVLLGNDIIMYSIRTVLILKGPFYGIPYQ